MSLERAGREPRGRAPGAALRLAGLKVSLLDLVIAVGRKVGGFCALLLLGWLYVRLLVLGHSPRRIYPDAADPDLRQTLWVALLLVMAQGWDIPTDVIVEHWARVRARWPERRGRRAATLPQSAPPRSAPPRSASPEPSGTWPRWRRAWRAVEPTVTWLERLMDLCVAVANKVGALAVLAYLAYLAWLGLTGVTARAMYPTAADPVASLLADVCVYVVVLGWWATPLEQIAAYWRRLRGGG